ncbi:MAG: hypothetical protein ACK4TP_06405 [Hyphomicrobium sp.]
MTLISNIAPLNPSELADYGQARVRDLAFDAIRELWQLRQSQGMKQVELASKLGRDPAWVSRNLRGPRNWTFKTFGAFLVALEGDLEMVAHPMEESCVGNSNYHAYVDFFHTGTRGVANTFCTHLEDSPTAATTGETVAQVVYVEA